MSTLSKSIESLVDSIQLVDKNFSPITHRGIEAVAHGEHNYPTLLLGLAAQQIHHHGIPSDEAVTFLYMALTELSPRPDIEYQLMGNQDMRDAVQFFEDLPYKIHSLVIGEMRYDPTIILHRIVANTLAMGGYRSETTIDVLRNGTQDVIRWRETFADKM